MNDIARVLGATCSDKDWPEDFGHENGRYQAIEVLRLKPRGRQAKEMAARLGVRVNTIESIIAGRSWKYLRNRSHDIPHQAK